MLSGRIFSLSKLILLLFLISNLPSSLSLDSVGELLSPVLCRLPPVFLPPAFFLPPLMAPRLINPWSLLLLSSLVPGNSSVYRLIPLPPLFSLSPYFFFGFPFLFLLFISRDLLGASSSSLSLLLSSGLL